MQFNVTEPVEAGVKAVEGDIVHLAHQDQTVVLCQETGVPMLNIDADQLAPGDLKFIKSIGLTISNPDTEKPVALGVDYQEESVGSRLKKYFEDDEEDDDDSSFFTPISHSSGGGLFGGGSSFGGFSGGGFGGFGGGSFGGGGASRSF